MCPLNDVSLERCVSWTRCPLNDASLGRRVPEQYVPIVDRIKVPFLYLDEIIEKQFQLNMKLLDTSDFNFELNSS